MSMLIRVSMCMYYYAYLKRTRQVFECMGEGLIILDGETKNVNFIMLLVTGCHLYVQCHG